MLEVFILWSLNWISLLISESTTNLEQVVVISLKSGSCLYHIQPNNEFVVLSAILAPIISVKMMCYLSFNSISFLLASIMFVKLLLNLQELEALADPMKKEVNVVRKKIDTVSKELKPLGYACQKKVKTLPTASYLRTQSYIY